MSAAPEFEVDVRRTGLTTVVAPRGEIDLATVPAVRSALRGAAQHSVLVLDLRGVEFMDSSGLALVVEEHRRAESEGHEFRVVRGPETVHRLFAMTGLTDRLRWAEGPFGSAVRDGRPRRA